MNDSYCKSKDILITNYEYRNCFECDVCETFKISSPFLFMDDLVKDYKQRLRVKKLNRIL